MNILFIAAFAVILIVVGLALWVGFTIAGALRREELTRSLRPEARFQPAAESAPRIFIDERSAGTVSGLIADIPSLRNFPAWLASSGLTWSPEFFFGLTFALCVAGIIIGALSPFVIASRLALGVVLALIGAMIPYWIASGKRNARLRLLESQLPEALDFIARAVRAGHAFSVSLEMLATDSPEPVRTEFRQLFNEVNLGSPLDVAMKNLIRRNPTPDVRFFVSAILIQRETGGNLSEILGKLSLTIRERFQLKAHVRAITAHGRMTSFVLTLMPIVFLAFSAITRPQSVRVFADDPHARIMLLAAFVMQILGYLIIRRMVNLKV